MLLASIVMSGNGNRFETGPDARLRRLNEEIRKLESRQTTWRNPVAFARLQAKRQLRDRIERSRLSIGWAALGTDGAAGF